MTQVDKNLSPKTHAASELFSAIQLGLRGEVSEEVAEKRKDKLEQDLQALEKITANPWNVVSMSAKEYQTVLRGGIALQLIRNSLQNQDLSTHEAKEELQRNVQMYSGKSPLLERYFEICDAQELLNNFSLDRLPKGGYKLLQAAQTQNKKDGSRHKVETVFSILSGGSIEFDEKNALKSCESLLRCVKEGKIVPKIPHIEEVIEENKRLQALSVIYYQKLGLYTGIPTLVAQPILAEAFLHNQEAAIARIVALTGLDLETSGLSTLIERAVSDVQCGSISSETLTDASIELTKKLILVGYEEGTTERILAEMCKLTELNEEISTVSPIDRGILLLGARIAKELGKDKYFDKEAAIERLLVINQFDGDIKEAERARYREFPDIELLGLWFLLNHKDTNTVSEQDKIQIESIFLSLLMSDEQLNTVEIDSFNELVVTIAGRCSVDISTTKYSKVSTLQDIRGIGELVLQNEATDKKTSASFTQAITKLEQLGKYELARVFLVGNGFVIRDEFQAVVDTAGSEGGIPFAWHLVGKETGKWILQKSSEAYSVQIPSLLLGEDENKSVHDIIWETANVLQAIDLEIMNLITSSLYTLRAQQRIKSLKVNASKESILEKIESGISHEELVNIITGALRTLNDKDNKLFTDILPIDDAGINNLAASLKELVNARVEYLYAYATKATVNNTISYALMPYHLVESAQDKRIMSVVCQEIFDSTGFIEERSIAKSINRILTRLRTLSIEVSREECVILVNKAVTNFAAYTSDELRSASMQIAIAPAATNSLSAYRVVQEIRAEALSELLKTHRASPVMSQNLHEDMQSPLARFAQRAQHRIANIEASNSFADSYSQTITFLPEIETLLQDSELKITLNQGEQGVIDAVGAQLFPDFNKKQRRKLAVLLLQRHRDYIENRLAVVQRGFNEANQQASVIIQQSNALLEIINTSMGEVGLEETFGVRKSAIEALPEEQKVAPIEIKTEMSPREPIVSVANNILSSETEVQVPDGFSSRHAQVVPQLYRGKHRIYAEKVVDMSNRIDGLQTSYDDEANPLRVAAQITLLNTSEEAARAKSCIELIENGIQRAMIPQELIIKQNEITAEKSPFFITVKNGGNVGFILYASEIIMNHSETMDISLAETRSALQPDDSVYTIVTGKSSKDATQQEMQEFLQLVKKAIVNEQASLEMSEPGGGQSQHQSAGTIPEKRIPRKKKPKRQPPIIGEDPLEDNWKKKKGKGRRSRRGEQNFEEE